MELLLTYPMVSTNVMSVVTLSVTRVLNGGLTDTTKGKKHEKDTTSPIAGIKP